MKISIIIVSYNEEKFISKAIESCLKQETDFPIEIIIGDDGSSDRSIEIISEYANKYPEIIKYFVMDRSDVINVIPSIRVSNVIKRAFSIATGDYFMLLSGDDVILDKDKLKVQVNLLENNNEYMSCYTNFKKFWNDGKEITAIMKGNISRNSFWSRMYMHISCFVFRKEVLNNVLDNFCDDTGLIFSIFITGKTINVNRMSFGYRQRDNSIMDKSDKLELYILELLLFEDVRSKKMYKNASLSRFAKPLNYVYTHRKELKLDKYNKYIEFSIKKEDSILGKMLNFDKLKKLDKIKIKANIFKASILRKIFKIYSKLEMFVKINFKFNKKVNSELGGNNE